MGRQVERAPPLLHAKREPVLAVNNVELAIVPGYHSPLGHLATVWQNNPLGSANHEFASLQCPGYQSVPLGAVATS